MIESVCVGREVSAQRLLDRIDGFGGFGEPHQIPEMPWGEGDDHETSTVAGLEIGAVGSVNVVAGGRPRVTVHLGFGQIPQGARDGQCGVLQRQGDTRTSPRLVAATHRRRDRQRRIDSADDIPCGQNMIHHTGRFAVLIERAGDRGKAEARVDGVVDAGCAVGAAEQFQGDHIGP